MLMNWSATYLNNSNIISLHFTEFCVEILTLGILNELAFSTAECRFGVMGYVFFPLIMSFNKLQSKN